MKLLMLKLLMITTLLSTSLLANKQIDENILKYEKRKVSSILKRQNIELNDISITLKKDLNQNGWFGYVFDLTFTIKGKKITQKDLLFANGTLIAPELINAKTKRSFKDILYPKLSKKYFDKKHLIAGNPDAKHTLVLFSDPLCPICIDEVPYIIKKVMDNPKNMALYYYHMPLDMHPTARTLSKAAMIVGEMGIKDVDYKVYTSNFGNFYDAYKETDNQKALEHFNKVFKTNITMKQINDPLLNQKLQYDMDMADKAFVNGTPTLFFDGEIDKTRMKYEQYLK
ncbi:MAG: disulfide bond formation protein DsbA [Arcobacter sp.]|nr:MAG: disulfide bond formation protein DsbA [Arcobacter sp.]